MPTTTLKQKSNLSHAKTLRRSRELLKITRSELASRLNFSAKAIQKYEAGRAVLDEKKLSKVLKAMGLSRLEYEKVRRGKTLLKGKKTKAVTQNSERRSYQKIITKECKVLCSLRRQIGLSQDQASALCGYSRPSIGHIENGRIELTKDRVTHILDCYGVTFLEFEHCLKKETQRDELVDQCVEKTRNLSDEKLNLLKGILESF